MFSPELAEEVNIGEYAHKIKELAVILEFWNNQNPVAVLASYINDDERFVYITHVSVTSSYRRKGLAKALIHKLMTTFADYEFRLEAVKDNIAAISLYESAGFAIEKERGNKYFMVATANSNRQTTFKESAR